MDSFSARVIKEHNREVAEDLHDSECEFRATGFFICNCSPRRRQREGYITPPGPLHFHNPTCPRCLDETIHDGDCFVCYNCLCHWPNSYEDAEFTDDFGDLSEDLARHERNVVGQ